MKEEIKITDLSRIFVGDVLAEFYIEVMIRLLFIFILALTAIRLMGQRMAARLSRNELVALVSLAAAIGMPIQAPDKGLLPAVVIATVIVFTGRWMSSLAFVRQRFERISQGDVIVLVENSVLNLKAMGRVRISRERLFAQLRSNQVKNLGAVKRLYIEANGTFSVIKEENPGPGLSVIPDWDEDLRREQTEITFLKVCGKCGTVKNAEHAAAAACPNCNNRNWINARL